LNKNNLRKSRSMFKKTIIGFFLAVLGIQSQAQQDLTIYNMDFIPQSTKVNPATRPISKFFISLPLPSVYFSAGNNGFNFKNLLTKDQNDSLNINFDGFLGQLADLNRIHATTNVDLLSFGFRIKEKNYFTFNASTYADVRFSYPKDLLVLIHEGNGKSFLEKPANLSGAGLDAILYHEFGLGYSRQLLDDKLTVGGKLKILKGVANVWTKTSNLTLETDANNFFLTSSGELNLLSSGIEGIDNEEASDILLKRKNNGVAIDLGGRYKITDKIEASASVIDLGFINWKHNPYNYKMDKSSFTFDGINIKDFLNNDSTFNIDSNAVDNYFKELGDSIETTFNVQELRESYKRMLYTKFYLGGTYNIDERQSAGVLLYSEVFKKKLRAAVSLQYQIKLGKWLSASANYSIYNRSASNLGFGLALNGGPIQLYVASDNLLALNVNQYDLDGGESKIIIPRSAKNVHARFGMNILIGKKHKDTDEDGIVDRKDDCPEVKGLATFNGCPDTDGDQIIDKLDSCATVAGIKKFNGCPDTDEDGIMDKMDSCPTEKGPEATKGCPDSDQDGVKDTEDACPEKAGPTDKNGCPDTDNDGLHDNEDNCLDESGPTENEGCPWPDTDGDSVLDKDDKCPSAKGPADNNGCPFDDLDGDGVSDKDDRCPNTAGPKENNGCPEIKKEEQAVLNTAFDNLEFQSGKNIIKASSYKSLEELAALLVKKPAWKLLVEGHTDSQGAAKTNLALSKKRAEAVKKFLTDRDVGEERIVTKGYGETRAVATNDTAAGRQKNRRVEMTVVFN